MQINSCTLEISLFYYDITYQKKELYTVRQFYWDQHNWKLSSEIFILTLIENTYYDFLKKRAL